MGEGKKAWFDLSDEGWRARNAARPLGELLFEGLQNALDQGVGSIAVDLAPEQIIIDDDAKQGFSDERLTYTVFLSNKGESATHRGRHGRGLKELISAMDEATIETVGFTVHFDNEGRHVGPNGRRRGTRITMKRQVEQIDLDTAGNALSMIIPPEDVNIRINGHKLKRPPRLAVLRDCVLDTVVNKDGVEHMVTRETDVRLFRPRPGERPHLYEMGLPIQTFPTPWHVDIAQRIPLTAGRDRVDETYRLRVLATLFESLMPKNLHAEDLNEDWVAEVIARCALSDRALDAYVKKAFPRRTVLPSDSASDDRARQSGANVLDTAAMSRGQLASLARVLVSSDAFLKSRQQVQEEVRAAHPNEQRAVAFLSTLARKVLGRPVRIKLMRKAPDADGIVESATFDRERLEMRINLAGHMDLSNPLTPKTLGILFHELAHAYADQHDLKFIQHLEEIAGRGAQILAHEGKELAEASGVPFVWPDADLGSNDGGFTDWKTPRYLNIRDLLKKA